MNDSIIHHTAIIVPTAVVARVVLPGKEGGFEVPVSVKLVLP